MYALGTAPCEVTRAGTSFARRTPVKCHVPVVIYRLPQIFIRVLSWMPYIRWWFCSRRYSMFNSQLNLIFMPIRDGKHAHYPPPPGIYYNAVMRVSVFIYLCYLLYWTYLYWVGQLQKVFCTLAPSLKIHSKLGIHSKLEIHQKQ